MADKETTVVNKTKGKFDVYIGRSSFFGNPYKIGVDGNREEVIEKYKDWFEDRLKDEIFLMEVLELRGKVLGCYCKPEACHGDVIVEFLDNYKE